MLPEGCIPGADQDLENCPDRRGLSYEPNSSTTFSRIGSPSDYFSLPVAESDFGGLNGSAEAGYDNLTFGWQGNNGPSIQNHTVFSYAAKTPFLGQFGLSHWPIYISNFNDQYQSLLDSFHAAGSIVSYSWSYTAGAHYRIDNAFASLTLGGKDTSKFDGNNLAQFQLGSDDARDLLVTLSAIRVSDTASSPPAQNFPVTVLVDSTVTPIYLPQSICSYFETTLDLVWDNSTSLYLLNSTQHDTLVTRNASVTFTIESTTASVNITLPYSAFDLTASYPLLGVDTNASITSYYFPLQPGHNESEYVLGRTFLQEAYLTVDYDRGNFSVAPAQFQAKVLGPSNSSSLQVIYPPQSGSSNTHGGKHDLSSGGIAGTAIAAVVLVLALLGLWFYLYRRRRSRKARQLQEQEAHQHELSKMKPELDTSEAQPGARDIKPPAAELQDHQTLEMPDNNKTLAEAMGIAPKELPGQRYAVEMNGPEYAELGGGENLVELPADEPTNEERGLH